MVRKKRKGVVKSDADESAALEQTSAVATKNGHPKPINLQQIVATVPADAELAFTLTSVELPVKLKDSGDVRTLSEWYALLCRASDLYEQLKVLQLFRSKCMKAADKEATSLFVVAAWKLMFRLYVSPEAEPLRKNFFLILEVLAQSDAMPTAGGALESPLQIAAGEELHLFLDRLWQENAAPATPDQSVNALDLLLLVAEFPFLARVLVNDTAIAAHVPSPYLLRFVKFCADQLAFLAGPIVDYNIAPPKSRLNDVDDMSASTNVVLLSSERCGHALKNGILVCTMKEFLYERLRKIESSQGFDRDTADFLRILGHCVLILQTSVVHKDLLTQAGLAYCLVLRLLLQDPTADQGEGSDPAAITNLLLQAIYPDKQISSIAAVTPRLRVHIDADMDSFKEFARLAVYRGMLNSLSDDELVLRFQSDGEQQKTVLDLVFSTVQGFCQEESLSTRLYAFQVLEAFLRRAVVITQRNKKNGGASASSAVPLSSETLLALTALVLLNWEHPSKKVNQFMAQMFTHVVNYFVLSDGFDQWKSGIVSKLVEFPQHSRTKYGALAILLGAYGAKPLLREHPTLLESVLFAVGHKDVSAAAAGLFAQILDDLSGGEKNKKQVAGDEAEKREWRLLWIDNVAQVLVSTDANLRSRVAMYAIPLLLKKDPDCVPSLIEKLRAAAKNQESNDADVCLWAIIEIMKYARKKVSPEKLLGLSTLDIEEGLSHAKPETRSSAFEAICASLKSTNMPTRQELDLVKKYLVIHGKEISPSSRMNTLNGLKTVLFRIKESLRINTKSASSNKISAETLQQQREDLELAQSFKDWVELFAVTSICSGAIPQRATMGLEVMLQYLQIFGFEPESILLSSHMVTSLLNMLISSWDVIRSLAYTVLELYPDDLPGFTSAEELTLLLKWSMALCVSARQRESDAGGLFMRLLFKKSATILRQGVEFHSEPHSTKITEIKTPQVSFVMKLTDVILSRLGDATANDKARKGELPLVHGLLLSLRYIVESVDFNELHNSTGENAVLTMTEWKAAMEQVFACIRNAMHFSLFVVGDATSGVGDEELSDAYTGVLGEVNSLPKTDAIPLRVDCRGHLILEDGEVGDDENDTEQRAVVGSWLSARECGAILDVVMRRVPLPRSDNAKLSFFTTEMAKQGGEMLLNSLFELKHKGAVAMAYQAFEGVCRSFLANSEKNPVIGGLPQLWADRLLDRLERSEQHFILRRSSGFAFSFVAILRSEPRNSAAIILPKVMANLLRLASLDTDAIAAESQQQQHLLWRSRVHALNILKLICQDAVLADDVGVYVAQMLEIAVFGFDCSSWAVRNSSMMLFAAATQRAIGDKRIADGASKLKVSSTDVFSRFQQLNGFIYRELEKCTSVEKTDSDVTPPGLYPILMFMSRLKPGNEDSQTADVLSASVPEQKALTAFIPLVMKCASQPTMAIRQMAGKVLAAIVRDDNAVAVLKELTSKLPNGVATPSKEKKASKTVKSDAPLMTNNYVHGVLTQIQYLVEKRLDVDIDNDGQQFEIATQVLAQLASDLLPSKLWLWTSDKVVSGSIRAVFLEIVESFAKFCFAKGTSILTDDIEHILTQIQAESGKDLQVRCEASAVAAGGAAPGEYVADRALVSIFFSVWKFRKIQWHSKSDGPGGMLPLVDHMLQSPVLEVRKRATKQLAKAIRGGSHFTLKLSAKAYDSLRLVLVQQLLVETHPKVRARQLQLLVHCQAAVDSSLPSEVKDTLEEKLLDILKSSADADVVAPVMELLATLVRDSSYSNESLCRTVKEEIVARSSEFQTLVLRQAAAKTIHKSGFLVLDAEGWTGEIALDCWMSAIKLLQDDDSNTRALICDAVQVALAAAAKSKYSLPRSASDTLVLPHAVAYVVAHFASTTHGAETLSEKFLALVDAPSILQQYSSGARGQDWGDLCDRIFEAESSNYFVEPDLAAQLFIYHLFAADSIKNARARSGSSGLFGFGTGSGASPSTDALAALRKRVLEKLIEVLKQLNSEDTQEQWIGGITYYSSVFSTLFCLLAAGTAIVTSKKHLPSKKMLSQIAGLAKTSVGKFVTVHPLIKSALEILSSANSLDHVDKDAITDLLYLTPYWTSLQTSSS
ncbi:Cell cycle-associated protein, partial [Globisporangium splendens]